MLEPEEYSLVKPVREVFLSEDMGPELASAEERPFTGETVSLPVDSGVCKDEDVEKIIQEWGFFDGKIHPGGQFENHLCRSGEKGVVIDQRTSLMWQTEGLDISSIRTMRKKIEKLNATGYAGYKDWRMPSLEEAMSLMNPDVNEKGVRLDPCFSMEYPFIFVAARRTPGGYWFVDYKHGCAFWSSGTIPGGFARLCRTLT